MKKMFAATGLALVLLAEASVADLRKAIDPLPGVVAEATVGSPLLTELEIIDVPPSRTVTVDPYAPVILNAALSMSIAGGSASVPAGEQMSSQLFDGRNGYVALDRFISAKGKTGAVIMLDLNGDSAFDQIWVDAGGKRTTDWVSTSLSASLPYEQAQPKVSGSPGFSKESFRRELLYLGYSKGTVRIQYREYDDRVARQAFYQDLSYDISQFPTTVSFRNYRIEILKADNSGIRYKVLEDR